MSLHMLTSKPYNLAILTHHCSDTLDPARLALFVAVSLSVQRIRQAVHLLQHVPQLVALALGLVLLLLP